MFARERAFVALANGTVAAFDLDAFESPNAAAEIVEFLTPELVDSSISALQPVDVDGAEFAKLFVTGRSATGQAFVSLLTSDDGVGYREIQRWTPNDLVAPGAMAVVRSILGSFEIFVAQDAQIPFVRISVPALAPVLFVGGSLAQMTMQVSVLAMPVFSYDIAQDIPTAELEEMGGGGSDDSMIGQLERILRSLGKTISVLQSAFEFAVGTILPPQVFEVLVKAYKDVDIIDRLPVVGVAQQVWSAFSDISFQQDGEKSTSDQEAIDKVLAELEFSLSEKLKTLRIESRQSPWRNVLAELVPQIDKLLESIPEWMMRPLTELPLSILDEGRDDTVIRAVDRRDKQRLHDIAFALAATGAAGFAWHFYDKQHAGRFQHTQA